MSINSEHLLIIPAKLPFFCQSTGKNVGVFSRGGSNSCCGRRADAFSTPVFEGQFSEWEEEKIRSEVVFPTSELAMCANVISSCPLDLCSPSLVRWAAFVCSSGGGPDFPFPISTTLGVVPFPLTHIILESKEGTLQRNV